MPLLHAFRNRASAATIAAAMITGSIGAVVLGPALAATTGADQTSTASISTSPASGAKATSAPTSAAQKAVLAHVDAHLATLKKKLAITSNQQSVWHGFAEVQRQNANELAAMYQKRSSTLATMNAVENMESYAAITAKRANDMMSLSAAFHTLYAKLSTSQQKTVDAMFRAQARKHIMNHKREMKESKTHS